MMFEVQSGERKINDLCQRVIVSVSQRVIPNKHSNSKSKPNTPCGHIQHRDNCRRCPEQTVLRNLRPVRDQVGWVLPPAQAAPSSPLSITLLQEQEQHTPEPRSTTPRVPPAIDIHRAGKKNIVLLISIEENASYSSGTVTVL